MAPRGPRFTIGRLGRITAWIALAAALARPSGPGDRVDLGHIILALLGCLIARYVLEAARAARRADTIPGRLFATGGLGLWLAVLLVVVSFTRGADVIWRSNEIVLVLLGAGLAFVAAGLIAWLFEVALAWRDHRRGRPRYILPPPPRDEGDGAGRP